MTGNLQLLTKLHDERVAEYVREMSELGYFDTEFTMYGCAYLEAGKRYYRISPNATDIYTFIEESNLRNIFPSDVVEFTKRCSVPSGMKEVIAQDVKVELAKQLSEYFPVEFFQTLYSLASRITENKAGALLWEQVDELEGVFDIQELREFEKFLDYMYTCRKVSEQDYIGCHKWLKEERKSMMENFETKDVFEKTMYGAMYLNGERVVYIEDASIERVFGKVYGIERKGGIVTPIISKTIWYNYRYRLADVIKDFKAELHNKYDKSYLEKLELVRRSDHFKDEFNKEIENIEKKYGAKAVETTLRYGNRWGVFRN